MWKKSVDKVRGSLTVRIFLITALILAATCGVTYGFLAWATPISYFSVVSDELDDRTASLIANLEQTTLEESGPLLDAVSYTHLLRKELADRHLRSPKECFLFTLDQSGTILCVPRERLS